MTFKKEWCSNQSCKGDDRSSPQKKLTEWSLLPCAWHNNYHIEVCGNYTSLQPLSSRENPLTPERELEVFFLAKLSLRRKIYHTFKLKALTKPTWPTWTLASARQHDRCSNVFFWEKALPSNGAWGYFPCRTKVGHCLPWISGPCCACHSLKFLVGNRIIDEVSVAYIPLQRKWDDTCRYKWLSLATDFNREIKFPMWLW